MLEFQPDSSLVAEVVPSPNQGDRRGPAGPDMIVLHYTGMASAAEALARLSDPASEVSAHYLVHEDGRVVQMVPEARRAWHAGAGSWGEDTDINSCSIGIEIVNGGHDFGLPSFPRRQIAAVIALCRGITLRRNIRADRVLGHSDIAPARKKDPGERFPWHLLAKAKVGHWVEPAPLTDPRPLLKPGDHSPEVAHLQSALSHYGYGIWITGDYDQDTATVVAAFQRHFRPAAVTGLVDASTLVTLDRLTAARAPEGAPPPA